VRITNTFPEGQLIDITRELTGTPVHPGNPVPELARIRRMEDGAANNLSSLSMCVHNATHADAPLHFIKDGRDIAQCKPEIFVGECLVRAFSGMISADDISSLPDNCTRLLIKGDATVTEEAAKALVNRGIILVGIERSAIGVPGNTQPVHLILLGANVGILEGLDLSQAPEGNAFVMAQPLKISGSEGAPCRALLYIIKQDVTQT